MWPIIFRPDTNKTEFLLKERSSRGSDATYNHVADSGGLNQEVQLGLAGLEIDSASMRRCLSSFDFGQPGKRF